MAKRQPLRAGDRVQIVHPPLSETHLKGRLARVYYVDQHTGYIVVETDDGMDMLCDRSHAFKAVHKG